MILVLMAVAVGACTVPEDGPAPKPWLTVEEAGLRGGGFQDLGFARDANRSAAAIAAERHALWKLRQEGVVVVIDRTVH